MRYMKGHGLHTRNRIVEEASYGLRQAGADGISVSDLMKLAGLTHGGFYAHFESREALVVEAFALAMDRKVSQWLKLMKGMPVEERFDVIVEEYLSLVIVMIGHMAACCRPSALTSPVQARRRATYLQGSSTK